MHCAGLAARLFAERDADSGFAPRLQIGANLGRTAEHGATREAASDRQSAEADKKYNQPAAAVKGRVGHAAMTHEKPLGSTAGRISRS
jgi:hypothetical protein